MKTEQGAEGMSRAADPMMACARRIRAGDTPPDVDLFFDISLMRICFF
jgi:hypothetical protein